MATAKKAVKAAKPVKAAAKTPARAPRAAAASARTGTATKSAAKPATKASAGTTARTAATRTAARTPAAAPARTAAVMPSGPVRPVRDTFTKTALAAHLAAQTSVEPRAVKAVLAALEQTMLGSLHKKGKGEFTMPGLMKVVVQQVPAKKRRFGKDPFTGEERWFDAKPASVKVKIRPMKKLKDAAA